MIKFFLRILRSLWPYKQSGEDTITDSENTGRDLKISNEANNAGDESLPPQVDISDDKLQLNLMRYSSGQHDTLGKLYVDGDFICFTLEPPVGDCIAIGTYEVVLREQGGKHSAYWYRFKDMHKGMLWIKETGEIPYAYFSVGNRVEDSLGSILLGIEVKNESESSQIREIWHSEKAYKNFYPKVVAALESGKLACLTIA